LLREPSRTGSVIFSGQVANSTRALPRSTRQEVARVPGRCPGPGDDKVTDLERPSAADAGVADECVALAQRSKHVGGRHDR
jgi:hypothetical protein